MKPTHFGVLIGSSLGLLACSSSPATNADAGPPPVLTITSPTPGARVVLGQDAEKSLPVTFTVQNIDLSAQGQCNGTAACAHVEVFIDGNSCNNSGERDNSESASSPIKAKLAKCPMPGGMHTLRLELHYNDFLPVLDASNQTVAAEVAVTALAPSLAITAPDAGATVTLGAFPDYGLSIEFALQNFVLAAPGSCSAGSEGACGSVFLLIDGATCDAKTGGVDQGYNNLVLASPGTAKFGNCPNRTGPHTVILELHNDDLSPLKDSLGGTLTSSISVTAQ